MGSLLVRHAWSEQHGHCLIPSLGEVICKLQTAPGQGSRRRALRCEAKPLLPCVKLYIRYLPERA